MSHENGMPSNDDEVSPSRNRIRRWFSIDARAITESQHMEVQVQEDAGEVDSRWRVRIRSGEIADAREVQAEWVVLERLATKDPRGFELLLKLAMGEAVDTSRLSQELRQAYLEPRGNLSHSTKVLLLCSARKTEEGYVLVDPFIHNEETDQIIERIREAIPTNIERLLRGESFTNGEDRGL